MNIEIIIPIIISIISLVFSIINFFYNSKRDKNDNILSIYSKITEARNYRFDYFNKKDFDIDKYRDVLDENYLNAFEYASHMYNKKRVDKESFEDMFKDLYASLFRDFGYADVFLKRFTETYDVYNSWKQKGLIKD